MTDDELRAELKKLHDKSDERQKGARLQWLLVIFEVLLIYWVSTSLVHADTPPPAIVEADLDHNQHIDSMDIAALIAQDWTAENSATLALILANWGGTYAVNNAPGQDGEIKVMHNATWIDSPLGPMYIRLVEDLREYTTNIGTTVMAHGEACDQRKDSQ